MRLIRGRFAVALLGAALASGCATWDGRLTAELAATAQQSPIELEQTPFFAQTTDQCGPAALATVLSASGVPTGPEELRGRVYLPGREGSLQSELLAATRQVDRIPYPLPARPAAVVAELVDGRPVLVMQNLGSVSRPVWHYAVVVGYEPESAEFVLRSGPERRHRLPAGRFLRTWASADHWAFVVLEPGALPADADADRYLGAVADLEATGRHEAAAAGYAAAAGQWPDNAWAWLGLGNARFAVGRFDEAERAYRQALAIDGANAVALNNLALAHSALGDHLEALRVAAAAIEHADRNSPEYRLVLETRAEIEAAARPD